MPDLIITAEARQRQIMELLEQEGSAKVEVLADLFSVRQVTIRKDLAELEEPGVGQRTYGDVGLTVTDSGIAPRSCKLSGRAGL